MTKGETYHNPEITISQRIVVKFVDQFQLPYKDGVEKEFPDYLLDRWNQLASNYDGITLKRLYTAVSPERIVQMVKEAIEYAAAKGEVYDPPNFLTFYSLKVRDESVGEELIKEFSTWDEVEYTYLVSPPVASPSPPGRMVSQYYLDPPIANPQAGSGSTVNIGGIHVQAAWNSQRQGCDGSGVTIMDIEKAWRLNHEDLVDGNQAPVVQQLPVDNATIMHCDASEQNCQSHGTSVLGILVSQDNGVGGAGIAYQATAQVLSAWTPGSNANEYDWNIANAILAANEYLSSASLNSGNVLLLEMQISCTGCNPATRNTSVLLPVEFDPAVFLEIEKATRRGITVVEAAGNGDQDLGDCIDSLNRRIHNPNQIMDSRAIIVAAAVGQTRVGREANLRKRQTDSNYGKRVDCFAAGNAVTTAADNETQYTDAFSGTSAASAIVAGVVVIIQAIAKHQAQGPLSFTDLRRVLAVGGMPAKDDHGDRTDLIGLMPNLGEILESGVF